MQVGVPTCREDTPLKEAARLLVERNVGALIVLDEDANMTGWIGEHHMARVAGEDTSFLVAGDVLNEQVPVILPDVPAAAAAPGDRKEEREIAVVPACTSNVAPLVPQDYLAAQIDTLLNGLRTPSTNPGSPS